MQRNESRQRGEEVHHGFPVAGACVDGVLDVDETDVLLMKVFDNIDQILLRPFQTVELEHEQRAIML